jgi:hypothetical protein
MLNGFMLFTLPYYVRRFVLLCLLRFPYEIMFGSSLSAIVHWTPRVFSCICLRILVSTRFDCISSSVSVLQDAETAYPSLSLGFNLVFIWAYGLSIISQSELFKLREQIYHLFLISNKKIIEVWFLLFYRQ